MSDGQLAFIGVILTVLATGGFGYWTAKASERRGVGTDTHSLATGQSLDSNLIPGQLSDVLHSMSEQLSKVMTDRDRIDREHRDALARLAKLERREGLLIAHIKDMQAGVEAGIYPPWKPLPEHD